MWLPPEHLRTPPEADLRAAAAQLGKVGVSSYKYYSSRFCKKEFWRNALNITSIYNFVSAVDQGLINGKMSSLEMKKSRVIGFGLNCLGIGDAMVKGHSVWLKFWRVTPETSKIKRLAVEFPFTTAVELAWFFPVYLACGVSKDHYLRSVLVSTGVNAVVQLGVLRGAHILNNYATNNPEYLKNISKGVSKFFGCETLSALAKRRLYKVAIVGLNTLMVAGWLYGPQLRESVLTHLGYPPQPAIEAPGGR